DEPTGVEEPEAVLQNRAAERVLVGRNQLVGLRLVHRRRRAPVVVLEGRPERAAEQVAARLGDGVDDAARETSELRGDSGGGYRRFLDRVLDVERDRLTAEVLVEHHAVQQEQVLERGGAADRNHAEAVRAVVDSRALHAW